MRRHGFHKFLRMCGKREKERERLFIISTVPRYSLYRRSPRTRGMDGLPSAESDEGPGGKRGREGGLWNGWVRKEDRPVSSKGPRREHERGETRGSHEGTRRSVHYRADRSAVGLAHYNFYDWSFGPLGALTQMPTCKGRITHRHGSISAEVSVAVLNPANRRRYIGERVN